MATTQYKIRVRFEGKRPIMFDRYAGDNGTSLQVSQKLYLNGNVISVPDINVFSLLAAENTKSTIKLHYPPKLGATLRHTVNSYLSIDERMIPLLDENNAPITFDGDFGGKTYVHVCVARLPKGIPNPKERPVIEDPWAMDFGIKWIENKSISVDALSSMFEKAGLTGLGTFRPMFGQFDVTKFDCVQV